MIMTSRDSTSRYQQLLAGQVSIRKRAAHHMITWVEGMRHILQKWRSGGTAARILREHIYKQPPHQGLRRKSSTFVTTLPLHRGTRAAKQHPSIQ